MSFAARLVHRLAIVTPAVVGDPEVVADLDEYGDATAGPDDVVLVRGLVQPRRTEEIAAISQAGLELSDHVIFLEPRNVPQGSYLVDADDVAPLATGRRFDIVGVRSFEYGRSPHLEVDVKLAGRSEGESLGS